MYSAKIFFPNPHFLKRREVYSIGLLVSRQVIVGDNVDFCGPETHLVQPRGNLETVVDPQVEPTNCTWTISTPKLSVIHVKLEYLQLGPYDDRTDNEENCLLISNGNESIEYLRLCADATNYYPETFSLPSNELRVTLETSAESHLSLVYASYVVNCSYDELKCYDARFLSRNVAPQEMCADGMLLCDELCKFGGVRCGGNVNLCYDVHEQRCDGKPDCPGAEDESGCTAYMSTCPDQIGCPDEQKCLTKNQICDEFVDCESKFDESNCDGFACQSDNGTRRCLALQTSEEEEEETEQTDLVYILTMAFSLMFLLFTYLICRCLTKRDRVRNMMDSPLDVPLPPFRGPGESSNQQEEELYDDEDFRPGGEIYESFFTNLNRIKDRRKRGKEELELREMERVTYVQPPDGKSVLDKYFNGVRPSLSEEFASLATIKISRDMCHGLRKAKSEEKPMTRLLFIDKQDDGSSAEDSEEEHSEGNCKRDEPTYSKSDTDYYRRKIVAAGPSHRV
ncbi:uncharacterized protein LOC126746774 [Anthonomus grandis grandis]|uniref:uncharacterized protein LOC126746774 n=1 Tax=Anthonomus grandis grandis TaxID=2921223 RepID=UPI00216671CB|nr:uncharacterized protein LOC126746774 [Anthonomus grandis grandis]